MRFFCTLKHYSVVGVIQKPGVMLKNIYENVNFIVSAVLSLNLFLID